jgi:hypothetical protein
LYEEAFMRALCGAIIVAGSLIGLGLFSIGVGTRYSAWPYHNMSTGEVQWVWMRHLDTALLVTLLALLITLAIGLGIAILGLAYHHHRRHLEMLYHQSGERSTSERPPAERVTV